MNRLAGNRFSIGITPSFDFDRDKVEISSLYGSDRSEETTKSQFYGASLNLSFESEKPVNLYWQRSIMVGVSTGWYQEKYPEKTDGTLSSLSAQYRLAYYPNSRTTVSGSLSEAMGYSDNYDQFTSSTSLSLGMDYYISPQFRLNVAYALVYDYRQLKDEGIKEKYYNKFPRTNLTVSLSYSLF